MKEKIKKYQEVGIISFIIFTIIGIIYNAKLGANDYLWNYSNIYKMTNGFKLYTDLNVIVTPLYFYIGRIFLLVSNKYIVYLLYNNIFINIFFLYVSYILLKELKIDFKIRAILLYVIAYIGIARYYNTLAIDIGMIGIIGLLKNKDNSFKYNVFQGLIIFLVFMSKQNIGVFYMIAYILYRIVHDKNVKKSCKEIIYTIFVSGILLSIFLLYLFIRHQLYDFINYTVLGIKEFAKYNISTGNMALTILISQLFLQIFFLILIENNNLEFSDKVRNNVEILSVFGFFMLFLAYPIFNSSHVYFASTISFISICYIIYELMFRELLTGELIEYIKKVALIILMILSTGICIARIAYNINNIEHDKESVYYGAIVSDEIKVRIDEVCQYIENQEYNGYNVKVISYYSNLFMNIYNRNNGDFDLPFNGNLGEKGEDGLIEKIKQLSNTKVLILTEEDSIYQESSKVVNYIKDNYEKECEVNIFSVYKIN